MTDAGELNCQSAPLNVKFYKIASPIWMQFSLAGEKVKLTNCFKIGGQNYNQLKFPEHRAQKFSQIQRN